MPWRGQDGSLQSDACVPREETPIMSLWKSYLAFPTSPWPYRKSSNSKRPIGGDDVCASYLGRPAEVARSST